MQARTQAIVYNSVLLSNIFNPIKQYPFLRTQYWNSIPVSEIARNTRSDGLQHLHLLVTHAILRFLILAAQHQGDRRCDFAIVQVLTMRLGTQACKLCLHRSRNRVRQWGEDSDEGEGYHPKGFSAYPLGEGIHEQAGRRLARIQCYHAHRAAL